MIGDISLATNIYIITGFTDMRKSIDGLYALVMDKLHEEPDRFSIYLFCGRRADRIKILLRESDGYDDLSDFSDELQMEVKRILEMSR